MVEPIIGTIPSDDIVLLQLPVIVEIDLVIVMVVGVEMVVIIMVTQMVTQTHTIVK